MTQYKVTYTRDEDNWWVATVPAIPGCHTQGKTVAKARERIVEAIDACLDDGDLVIEAQEDFINMVFQETITVRSKSK